MERRVCQAVCANQTSKVWLPFWVKTLVSYSCMLFPCEGEGLATDIENAYQGSQRKVRAVGISGLHQVLHVGGHVTIVIIIFPTAAHAGVIQEATWQHSSARKVILQTMEMFSSRPNSDKSMQQGRSCFRVAKAWYCTSCGRAHHRRFAPRHQHPPQHPRAGSRSEVRLRSAHLPDVPPTLPCTAQRPAAVHALPAAPASQSRQQPQLNAPHATQALRREAGPGADLL